MISISKGCNEAFSEIVARWQGPLMKFFRRKTRDQHHAEDLCQETFTRIHRAAGQYNSQGRFKGWLWQIAGNLLVSHARKQSRDLACGSFGDEKRQMAIQCFPDTHEHDSTDRIDSARRFAGLLEKLPDDQRAALFMFQIENRSLKEIAETTDTSLPTVKGRLRLARMKLRELSSRRVY